MSPDQPLWKQIAKTQIIILGGMLLFMWILEIADYGLGGRLDSFGIYPRSWSGMKHLFFAPFLHGGFAHLIANSIPFLILGALVMLRGVRAFSIVTLITIVVGGLGVWLFGSAGTHLGASILIFGFLGYLLLNSYFERSAVAILLAVVVMFFYSGVLFGLLPGQTGVSWTGHLFGFIGGGAAARSMAARTRVENPQEPPLDVRILP